MRWPEFIVQLLLRGQRALNKILYRQMSRSELHDYWGNPPDSYNKPASYLEGEERSRFLLEIVERHVSPTVKVLEIGCNIGRNLEFLHRAGFVNLAGIEINEEAVQLLKARSPGLARAATIHTAPAETVLPTFQDQEFDLIFTMAVLEHIHTDSEWIFPEVARITKEVLLTIEDEGHYAPRNFPRNYRNVFEPLGFTQVEKLNCEGIEGLGLGFVARVFTPTKDGQS